MTQLDSKRKTRVASNRPVDMATEFLRPKIAAVFTVSTRLLKSHFYCNNVSICNFETISNRNFRITELNRMM